MDTVRATSLSLPRSTRATSAARPVTPDSLISLLGRDACPLVIDVRRQHAFNADTHMLAGATWRDPFEVSDWAKYLPRHRPVVVYCVHGFEISKNTADALAADGIDAGYLVGGIDAWRTAGGATTKKSTDPVIPSVANEPSVWVTRARPKIVRIACPWLICRFIDQLAEFVYVPAAEVTAYATQTGAIAYDVPDVRFTHRGEFCSFDALIADFDLRDHSLTALADIVRGADTGKPQLTPQSPGLLALSLGLSSLYEDDHEMLAHGMIVYDSLYAWLQSARDEVHNANLFKKSTPTS
jgi:rhodanese-related sulfurtransferase